jgi:hypothetical protein
VSFPLCQSAPSSLPTLPSLRVFASSLFNCGIRVKRSPDSRCLITCPRIPFGLAALDQVTPKCLKSIRELKDFKIEKLNVLVGAPDPERRTREMI